MTSQADDITDRWHHISQLIQMFTKHCHNSRNIRSSVRRGRVGGRKENDTRLRRCEGTRGAAVRGRRCWDIIYAAGRESEWRRRWLHVKVRYLETWMVAVISVPYIMRVPMPSMQQSHRHRQHIMLKRRAINKAESLHLSIILWFSILHHL